MPVITIIFPHLICLVRACAGRSHLEIVHTLLMFWSTIQNKKYKRDDQAELTKKLSEKYGENVSAIFFGSSFKPK